MTELDRHFLPPSSAHALSEPLADAHCDVRPDVASKLTGNPGFLTDHVASGPPNPTMTSGLMVRIKRT